LLQGELYTNQKKYAEAEGAFRKAIQTNAKIPGAYMDLAKMYFARNDAKTAVQALQQGLSAIPGDLSLSNALAEAYQSSGDYDKAIAEYEVILKANPKADAAANNLASLLTDKKGDKVSLDRALELAKRFENSASPAAQDTLGWVYYKLGQSDKAVPLLQKVVDKAPQAVLFHYHLGMALYKKGDNAGAKEHLKMAVGGKVNFPGLDEAKATLAKL
jgi:tetratricopeptide (TPR) repeat protein